MKSHWIVGMILANAAGCLFSQTAGNPIQAVGQRQWTMGLSGNYMNQEMEYNTAASKRVLMKSMWGVNPWLGLYGTIGMVQLSLDDDRPDIADYKDRFRFAYGAGLHWQFDITDVGNEGLGIWGDIQVLKFNSQGSFLKHIPVQDDTITRTFGMKYDWGEMLMSGGFVLPMKNMRIYAGGVGWVLQRKDEKRETLTDLSDVIWEAQTVRGTYQSGLWTGAIVGVEFLLPKMYSIVIEGLAFNRKNYQIMVGISQTGSSDW